ncbi:MAG: diacylglycerol kinase [Actinomycetota bacterium]|nr:diacylglycerol kinase [Actinomycetota bacterium]
MTGVGQPRRIALLTNPTAGKGKGARCAAIALPRLREAGYDVQALAGRSADEALDLARRCVTAGIETLVVCGGDGMVHLGVQAVAGTGTRLGIVPSGTGNDVARYLDLPRTDPQRAADVVIGSRERTIDLAKVGSTYFVTVLAAGFDAMVNERANQMTWPRGQMRYNLATVAELRTLQPIPYVLELDGAELRVEATLVAVGNGPSFGGGLRITEGAVLDDGLLDVVIIKPLGKLELLRTYPKLFRGTHIHHPQYQHHRVREVSVAAPGIVAYADGERIGPLPLTVEVAPGALRVVVP